MNCPKCQTDTPEINKFCRECGSKLAHACPQCGAGILLQDKIEGERKQVTLMFFDTEGFTQLTERVGPEEAYAMMDQVCKRRPDLVDPFLSFSY